MPHLYAGFRAQPRLTISDLHAYLYTEQMGKLIMHTRVSELTTPVNWKSHP